jgi:dCMP deaminase
VRDKRLLSTGYNGAPRGTAHCLDVGCLRDQLGVPSGERHELCRAIHAEQNAIIQAAVHGVAIEGATLYCTHRPCILCAKMLINCGVKEIHFLEGYPDELSSALFAEAGVVVTQETLPSTG